MSDVVIDIEARVAGAERKLKDFENKFERNGRQIKNTSDRIERSFKGLGRAATTLAGFLGVAFTGAAIRSALEYGEAISDTAQRVNASVEGLQRLRDTADKNGVSFQQLDDVLQRQTRRLGEFANSGAGPAKAALDALGISSQEVGRLINQSSDTTFLELVDRLNAVENAAQRSALAAQLFGDDSGPKLAALIDQGSAAIRRQGDEAERAGRILSAIEVDKLAEANVALRAAGQTIQTSFAQAVAAASDEIQILADAIAKVVRLSVEAAGSIGAFINQGRIQTEARLARQLQDIQEERRQVAQALEQAEAAGDGLTINALDDQLRRLDAQFERIKERRGEIIDLIQASLPSAPGESSSGSQTATRGGRTGGTDSGITDQRAEQLRLLRISLDLEQARRDGNVALERQLERQLEIMRLTREFEALGLENAQARAEAERRINALLEDRPDEGPIRGRTADSNDARDRDAVLRGFPDAEAEARERERFRRSFTDGVKAALDGDLGGFIADRLARAADNMFDRALDNLADRVFDILNQARGGGPVGGGIGGILGSLGGLGGIFGSRASGGAVSFGRPFLVGERGPEIFVPPQSGQIVANGQMRAGVTIINNAPGVFATPRETSGGDVEVIIETIAGAIRNGGNEVSDALDGAYALRRGGI